MIVHITDCFHPRLGGIEMQVGELAAAQVARGDDVHVITATQADPAGGDKYDYAVHRVIARLPWQLPIHPRASAHLVPLLRRLGPDVVHVHVGSVSPFAWSAVRSALRCGLPTVVTVHSMWGAASRTLYRFLDRISGWTEAPLVVTSVSAASATLIARARPSVVALPVPNGIAPLSWRWPAETAEDAVAGPPPPADEPAPVHIVAVGRLAPRKQPLGLLKLLYLARLRTDPRIPLRVTVAGDGPALSMMRGYLQRHDMTSWVHLCGRLDRDGIRRLLHSADLFVNPTVRESFGIATLEARTAGVPVIARTGNGVCEFIQPGVEGVLCDSADDLVRAIVELASDPEARHRIRDHNRTTEPENCTWPAVTAAFADCYDRAVTTNRAPVTRRS